MLKAHPSHLKIPRSMGACFVLLCLLLSSCPVAGQNRRTSKSRRQSKGTAAPKTPQVTVLPRPKVFEANTGGDLFRSGDVFMRATQNSHMTVPIGMSQGAPVLVEFPADDPLYSIHEGNAKLAYVNCGQMPDGGSTAQVPRQCNLRPTDPLVLQSGELFVPPTKEVPDVPTTVITVQRVSGMVISFIIFFVSNPTQNANRVVVSYDLNEVLAARRKAGLLTQLVPPSELAQAGVPSTSPLVTGAPSASPSLSQTLSQSGVSFNPSGDDAGVTAAPEKTPADVMEEKTVAELQRVAGQNLPLNFSKPLHGLSLAVLSAAPPVGNTAIQVIAVRNTLAVAVRLMPDQPELRIMQAAKKGEAVLDQTLSVLHVATSVGDDNVLQPGQTYYYAVAYAPPALGVKQSLYVSFAHMLATDEPAIAPLTFQLAAR